MIIHIHRHPGAPNGQLTAEVRVAEFDETDRVKTLTVEPDGASRVVLRQVFNGVTFITEDGETLVVNMRDSGFEIAYQTCPDDAVESISLQHGDVTVG